MTESEQVKAILDKLDQTIHSDENRRLMNNDQQLMWKDIASAISTLLTLAPHLLSSYEDNQVLLMDLVGASSLLASIVHSLGKQHSCTIQSEADAILMTVRQVQWSVTKQQLRKKSLPSSTPSALDAKSIHSALITHARQLVDGLLMIPSSGRLSSDFSQAREIDSSWAQIFPQPKKSHSTDVSLRGGIKRRSTGTIGTRFMRTLSTRNSSDYNGSWKPPTTPDNHSQHQLPSTMNTLKLLFGSTRPREGGLMRHQRLKRAANDNSSFSFPSSSRKGDYSASSSSSSSSYFSSLSASLDDENDDDMDYGGSIRDAVAPRIVVSSSSSAKLVDLNATVTQQQQPMAPPRPANGEALQESLTGNPSIFHVYKNEKVVLVLQAGPATAREKHTVVAGTTSELFSKLLDDAIQDFDYIDTYLITHKLFTVSSLKLFEKLTARFNDDNGHGAIQRRVIDVISRWIKLQFEDFKKERRMMQRLHGFLYCGDQAGYQKEMDATRDAVTRQRARLRLPSYSDCHKPAATAVVASFPAGLVTPPASPVSISSSRSSGSSSTISNSSNNSINTVMLSSTVSVLSCLDALEVAQYLTLADFTLFKHVTAHEYLSGGWRRGEATDDEFTKIITTRANMVCHWVKHEICCVKLAKQRRDILRKWIRIAKLCIEWKNFHTAMNITMALECSTIRRLDHAWQHLSSRDIQSFQQLQRYMDVTNNMQYYRHALDQAAGRTAAAPLTTMTATASAATTTAAVMPFFPLVLKDLTFFMDGNPTVLAHHPPLINFDKCRTLTRFLARLAGYASVDYWFATDLDHFPFLPHVPLTRPPRCQPSTRIASLDRVAELIESKIQSVQACHQDRNCQHVID